MARLERIGDKKFRIVYDVRPTNGRLRQQKTETLCGVTKAEATAILAKRDEARKRGDFFAGDDMSLSELFEKFMLSKRRRIEATSIDRYSSLIATYLRPELGAVKLASLRKAHVMDALDAWQDRQGRKPSGRTIRHAFDLLRAVLNWALSHDYVATNVASRVSPEERPKALRAESAVLDETELSKLLLEAESPTRRSKKRGTLSAQPWFFGAVAFAAYTGARRGEVLAIKWADLNLPQNEVTIRSSLAEPRSGLLFKRPKNGRSRTITLGVELGSILRSYRVSQAKEKLAAGPSYKDADLVFANPNGEPIIPWSFGAAFKDLVARTKVNPITLHGLRDTHASLLAKAGIPIEVISRRLGHSGIAITVDRYVSVYMTRDCEAAGVFERLLAGTLREKTVRM